MTDGVTLGVTEWVTLGVTEWVTLGVTEGVLLGVTEGVTLGVTEGVLLGVVVGDGFTVLEGDALGDGEEDDGLVVGEYGGGLESAEALSRGMVKPIPRTAIAAMLVRATRRF